MLLSSTSEATVSSGKAPALSSIARATGTSVEGCASAVFTVGAVYSLLPLCPKPLLVAPLDPPEPEWAFDRADGAAVVDGAAELDTSGGGSHLVSLVVGLA